MQACQRGGVGKQQWTWQADTGGGFKIYRPYLTPPQERLLSMKLHREQTLYFVYEAVGCRRYMLSELL